MTALTPLIHELSPDEFDRYSRLPLVPGAAWKFWRAVCAERRINLAGTDKTTVSIFTSGATFRVVISPRKLHPASVKAGLALIKAERS